MPGGEELAPAEREIGKLGGEQLARADRRLRRKPRAAGAPRPGAGTRSGVARRTFRVPYEGRDEARTAAVQPRRYIGGAAQGTAERQPAMARLRRGPTFELQRERPRRLGRARHVAAVQVHRAVEEDGRGLVTQPEPGLAAAGFAGFPVPMAFGASHAREAKPAAQAVKERAGRARGYPSSPSW